MVLFSVLIAQEASKRKVNKNATSTQRTMLLEDNSNEHPQ